MALVVVDVRQKVKMALYLCSTILRVTWSVLRTSSHFPSPSVIQTQPFHHYRTVQVRIRSTQTPPLPPQYIERLRGIILMMEIGPTDIEMVVINSEREHIENPGEDTPVELQASLFPEDGGNGSPSVLLGWYSTAKINLILAINSVSEYQTL